MNRRRWLIIASLIAVLALSLWRILSPKDYLFHGKPESEWISGIAYFGDDAQKKQWRDFGADGLHVLASALNEDRLYRKTYRRVMPRLPAFLASPLYRALPNPASSHRTRMAVAGLICQMGKAAKPIEPSIARALDDDDAGVRQIALGCYEELLPALSGEG